MCHETKQNQTSICVAAVFSPGDNSLEPCTYQKVKETTNNLKSSVTIKKKKKTEINGQFDKKIEWLIDWFTDWLYCV